MTQQTSSEKVYIEEWLPGRDGMQFYTRTYAASSPQAVVLYVHGFAEYVGRYEWAHGVYAARGITVFAFDQRGFGLTALSENAKKNKESKYGKTSWKDQLADIEWWLKHVKSDQHPRLPVYLMGHSMGGALSLGFVTRTSSPPAKDSVSLVSGVIAASPCLLLTRPTPGYIRSLGRLVSKISPSLLIPARVDPKALSHDKAIVEKVAKDPLCPKKGSAKGVMDILDAGEQLVLNDYKNWPQSLPVLLIHGTADKVTSFNASEQFYEKVWAHDKDFIAVEDGYHELVNETDEMKHNFVDNCISWILRHVAVSG